MWSCHSVDISVVRREHMKCVLALALLIAWAGSLSSLSAQSASKASNKRTGKTSQSLVSTQLAELKQSIQTQQQQIDQLSQQVQSRDQRIEQLEQKLEQNQTASTRAQAKADSAAAQSAEQQKTVATLTNDVTDLKANTTSVVLNLQETQKSIREQGENPLAIRFKGITLQPGGFLAAESIYRKRGLSSDINTPFNSVNMPGAGQNKVSEFFGSARQSRISLLAEGKVDHLKM